MISCIIPVFKPDKSFDETIRMLLMQKEPVFELVLINTRTDDFDSDKLRSRVSRAIKGLKLTHKTDIVIKSIERSSFDHGGTRGLAASMVKGDYMLVMTQDAVPKDENLTAVLARAFENENVAVAYARQLPKADAGEKERYTRTFNYPGTDRLQDASQLETKGIKAFFCSDVCAMYNKAIFDELGGFVDKTIFNEDMIFARKAIDAGYSISYCSKAEVYHSHNYDYISQLRRSFDLAVSQKQFREVFSDVKSESEGIRFVSRGVSQLFSDGKLLDAADLFFDSGFRYLGYLLGKNYEKLPKNIVKMISLNRGYWEDK